jgi:hypothetical protein
MQPAALHRAGAAPEALQVHRVAGALQEAHAPVGAVQVVNAVDPRRLKAPA